MTVFALLFLLLEGEKAINRLFKKEKGPSFERDLKNLRAEFSDALGQKFSNSKRVELKDRLFAQCQHAERLSTRWYCDTLADEDLRTIEADAAVEFEEEFTACVKELVEEVRQNANEKVLSELFVRGSRLINDFEYYLFKLEMDPGGR